MEKVELQDLLEEIKKEYPSFDVSVENENRLFKYLSDFPFEAAMQNVEEHIKTNKFPPTIAEIRGRLGDQMDSKLDKELAASYHAQIELWYKNAGPPPDGMRERVYAMCREAPE